MKNNQMDCCCRIVKVDQLFHFFPEGCDRTGWKKSTKYPNILLMYKTFDQLTIITLVCKSIAINWCKNAMHSSVYLWSWSTKATFIRVTIDFYAHMRMCISVVSVYESQPVALSYFEYLVCIFVYLAFMRIT